MKVILGKKMQMTQKFMADGTAVPVTAVLAGPCQITQIKNQEKDGYLAIQIGFAKSKKISKPLAGHLQDLEKTSYLREFLVKKNDVLGEAKRGDKITVADFVKGEKVQVEGVSKGMGFAGVVKRHHFHGHPKSHGHKDQLRMPGSIGAGGVQNVFKGVRMGGRMGGDQVTVKNLEIVDIDTAKNLLYIKGAVPGARNSMVEIRVTKSVAEPKAKK